MGPTLLVLAAGMGSRYGGLKQLDHFGPSGETIMDYAIHDALAAGFDKVVFVIRRDFEADFRAFVGGKYEQRVAVDYVFQEHADLPAGSPVPAARSKPWGTAHAIWCARSCVREAFCSLNADDYYGKHAFGLVARHLMQNTQDATLAGYCIVGYPILQTLSAHGGVARALCEVDQDGWLTGLRERTGIERSGDTGRYLDDTGRTCVLDGTEVVSMNMMGFFPAVFAQIEEHLRRFLERQSQTPDQSECLIPVVVDQLVRERRARVRVLPTTDAWFGVTHAADRTGTVASIAEMVRRGDYPSPIWQPHRERYR
jgi:hypothetical protein